MTKEELEQALSDVADYMPRGGVANRLSAHIAALEQERDAASAREFGVMVTNSRLTEELERVRAMRDAAVADNAALLEEARMAGHEYRSAKDMAEDPNPGRSMHLSTCRHCAVVNAIHPGAALLEEHRKALVRARNEGREEAAALADRKGLQWYARSIRALKEPEE